jgi:solute carrier family 9B (sodium/hydrogen exchanger), member 1/2
LHALSVGLAGVATITAGLANGESILSLAVLAILFTAPLGLLGIRILGPRLLDVTLPPDDEDD